MDVDQGPEQEGCWSPIGFIIKTKNGIILDIEDFKRVRFYQKTNRPGEVYFGKVLADEYENFVRQQKGQITDKIRCITSDTNPGNDYKIIIRQWISSPELPNSSPQNRLPANYDYDPEAGGKDLQLRKLFYMTPEFENEMMEFFPNGETVILSYERAGQIRSQEDRQQKSKEWSNRSLRTGLQCKTYANGTWYENGQAAADDTPVTGSIFNP